MNMTPYRGFGSPFGLQREFARWFDSARAEGEDNESDVVTSQWAPRVDIKEEDDRFVIFADVPGVEPKDIEVHMENGMLSIRGERTTESVDENDRYTRVERAHGVFYRRFALPDTADANGIKARGKHGVLEIEIPKRAETKPRRITVND